MCEKSLGVSSSLNKMAAAAAAGAAAPLQGSTVVRVPVASPSFHTLGDAIYWFCWRYVTFADGTSREVDSAGRAGVRLACPVNADRTALTASLFANSC